MDKINLHCADKSRDGYSNIDARSSGSTEDYKLMKYKDSSCEEIIAHAGCLESVSRSDVVEVIKCWHRKLSSGGVLKLSFLDLKKLSNAYCYDRLQINDVEDAVVGMKSFHDMFELRSALIALGFKVKFCDYSIEDYIGSIHAEK